MPNLNDTFLIKYIIIIIIHKFLTISVVTVNVVTNDKLNITEGSITAITCERKFEIDFSVKQLTRLI